MRAPTSYPWAARTRHKLRSIHRAACLAVIGLVLPHAPAQPLITPDAAVLKLDEIGLYTVGYAYRGQPEVEFPLGWSGFFEEHTGVACLPYGVQSGRRVFLLHSPWRGGTGTAFQQFHFNLPTNVARVRLRGATAMRPDIVGKSDGATFRVFANGVKRLDWHHTNDVWQSFEFDLTTLRGSNLVVRFEIDPGPKHNPAWDYSFWGDRELVLKGYTPPPRAHPAPIPLTLSNLLAAQTGEVAPRSGFAGRTSVQLADDTVRLCHAGLDGVLEYQWLRPTSDTASLFGGITLRAQMTGQPPVSVPLANSANLLWTSAAKPVSSTWQTTSNGCALLRTFSLSGTNVLVRIRGQLVGKSLVLTVSCDHPVVTGFDAGMWGPTLRRRQIVTPYYGGQVFFLPLENLFVNAFLDWTASAASVHEGRTASYGALTDGTDREITAPISRPERNRLNERVVFSAAWHLAEVFPNIPNPPSPWREFLADKIVLDNWGGSFAHVASNLTNLADYGITNCVALIHVWQRSGYDNALPAHYPAAASQGGDAAMSNLVATATRLGIRAALHENYVDYYPNYDSFNTNDIALDSAGKKVPGWFNEGTGIQSFAVKPNAILRLAASQSPEIHARYRTEANYLDVHSAVPPWFHVDFRASEPGAGQFARVWEIHHQLWAYERTTHGGPTFGEGNNHWYWSGLLDGVEAQFGTGWPANAGFTAPLSVDFDLLKIHPLQFNHGMGYYERWWPHGGDTNWGGLPPMIVLDQYRMQEVAYARAGFLAGSTYDCIPLAWLEHHLLTPVMARYATARPLEIVYESGGAWLDATAIAKLENGGTNNRVRVTYDNGLVITANGAADNLQVDGRTLPQFGWLAIGAGVTAGTVLREGVVTDFADTGNTLFINARPAKDWNLSNLRRVQPRVVQFEQTAARTFRVAYQWDVQEGLGKDYRCFVHFTTNGAIRWQQDHAVSPPTAQWQPGQRVADGPWTVAIPPAIPDDDYVWRVGLFDPASGARVRLSGADDGSSSIRAGVVRVRDNGRQLTFTAETGKGPDRSHWYRRHLNEANQIVDFGDVRTDGSVWLRREGKMWLLKTWPRTRNFTLELSVPRFGRPAKIECVGGSSASLTPTPARSHWRLPLNGAREYRWANTTP